MTALDIVVLAVMAGAAILGFMRGFVQEVFALLTWLLVLFAVRFLHAPVTEALVGPVGTEGGAAVAAFLLILIVVYIAGKLIARGIGKRTRNSVLGPVDRVLGFGFGLVKGLAVMSLLFLLVLLIHETIWGKDEPRPEWITQSRTYPLLNASGAALSDLIAEQRDGAKGEDANSAR